MEPQKILKSQSNLFKEKKKKAGDIVLCDFKLYYKAMVIRTICYHHMKRHIGPWNRIESPWNKHTHIWSIQKKSVLNIHWKDWCWCWNSNTLVTWCKELSHWKRPWCWERLKTGGEGDNRGWDGWMASSTQWIWIWASSGSWWWTGRPDVQQSIVLQSQTRLSDWTDLMTD